MSDLPPIFRQRIAEHNRHCWVAVGTSLLGAWLVWMFYAAIFTALVLLFEVVRTGDVDIMGPPWWFLPLGGFLVLGILIGAAIDRWRRRFRPVTDRQIIGWHLIPEVILLPAKMTFAIADHIGARVRLSGYECREAWRILRAIWMSERADVSELAGELTDRSLLQKILPALQLTDWIDLHSNEGEWYYRVRTDQEDILNEMLPKREASESDSEAESE